MEEGSGVVIEMVRSRVVVMDSVFEVRIDQSGVLLVNVIANTLQGRIVGVNQ
jgi:hypothetical protein